MVLAAMSPGKSAAQLTNGFNTFRVGAPRVGAPLILINTNKRTSVTPQDITPNLAVSNVTPAIGQPPITPAMPASSNPVMTLGSPAITPNSVTPGVIATPNSLRTVPTAIGQQGFGGAIGQQGSGTAIGQQGSGTALGQQGSGTAIIPPTSVTPNSGPIVILPTSIPPTSGTAVVPQNNAIVIGQPETAVPAPVSPPVVGVGNSPQPALAPGTTPQQRTIVPAPAARPAPVKH